MFKQVGPPRLTTAAQHSRLSFWRGRMQMVSAATAWGRRCGAVSKRCQLSGGIVPVTAHGLRGPRVRTAVGCACAFGSLSFLASVMYLSGQHCGHTAAGVVFRWPRLRRLFHGLHALWSESVLRLVFLFCPSSVQFKVCANKKNMHAKVLHCML